MDFGCKEPACRSHGDWFRRRHPIRLHARSHSLLEGDQSTSFVLLNLHDLPVKQRNWA
jgi:hypothetical protein